MFESCERPFSRFSEGVEGQANKGLYRKVSGRYRIIFEPNHKARTIEVLGVFIRNERTYK